MFLKLNKQRTKTYLQIAESFNRPGKSPGSRTVKGLGDFYQYSVEVQNAYHDKEKRRLLLEALVAKYLPERLHEVEPNGDFKAVLTDDGRLVMERRVKQECRRVFAKRYGHLVAKAIWDTEFNLRYKLNYLQKTTTNIGSYSLNDLLFFLAISKLLQPKSYLNAYNTRGDFLYAPWADIPLEAYYRALDFVHDNADDILQHAVRSHFAVTKKKVSVAFFDCTNTWFETPYDDLTWQIIRYIRQTRKELSQHWSSNDIESYLDSEEFSEDLALELELSKDDLIRMRGPSKQERYSCPLVCVALAIDQSGFPIDCKVFAGNLSELKTVEPMLESLRSKYDVTDSYFVADRGLNSVESLLCIQNHHLGFVVAQKVTHQLPNIRKKMLEIDGYQRARWDDEGRLYLEAGAPGARDFRIKVDSYVKEAHVADPSLGTTPEGRARTKLISVHCHVIYTFNYERQQRDLAELKNQIAKATAAIQKGALMGNPYGSGWRSLVATEKDSATKSGKEQYRAIKLKDDVIKQRKETAGYAAIVYAHPTNQEASKLSPTEVLETYHRLVSIEDCFRTLKTHFSIRPMHVWSKEHIIAHCHICVWVLMLLRSIQEKLQVQGVHLSTDEISSALRQAYVSLEKETSEQVTVTNISLHQDEDVNPNVANHLDLILKAVDLTPLDKKSTLGEVKKRLKIHTVPNDKVLSRQSWEAL